VSLSFPRCRFLKLFKIRQNEVNHAWKNANSYRYNDAYFPEQRRTDGLRVRAMLADEDKFNSSLGKELKKMEELGTATRNQKGHRGHHQWLINVPRTRNQAAIRKIEPSGTSEGFRCTCMIQTCIRTVLVHTHITRHMQLSQGILSKSV
jgi:hypothetical protein